MNDTQVAALDHTIQETNTWLKKLTGDHHLGDRCHGYTRFAQCCTFCATAWERNSRL